MNERLGYLDFLRGIAIIIVVMGHIIQYNLKGDVALGCFNFIYSFHMGFFFFISGCAASLSFGKNTWDRFFFFVTKKGRQLLVPFVVWGGGIPLVFRDITWNEVPQQLLLIFQYPDRSVWFLLFLFCIQFVYFVACAISSKKKSWAQILILLGCVPFIAALLFVKKRFIGIEYSWISPDYLLLFLLGHFAQTYSPKIKYGYGNTIVVACFLVFVVFAPMFDFLRQSELSMRMIKIVASSSFSLAAFFIIKQQYERICDKATKFCSYMGTHTLEIYVTHFLIIQICTYQWLDVSLVNEILLLIIIFFASILFSLVTIKVADGLKRIPGLSLLLYGQN